MTQGQPIEVRIPVPWGYIAGCWYGDQRERPLLALHGWKDNAGSFARFAPLIADQRALLAIDFPGHGRSSHFPAGMVYRLTDFIRVVQRIARHYKWNKISFIGHSIGAAVSFHYAGLFPNSVDMIIAIDALTAPYHPPEIHIDAMLVSMEKILDEEERLRGPKPRYTYESLQDLLYRSSGQSVKLEHCKFLLERSVRRVEDHPDMYYLTRDSRIKVMDLNYTPPELLLAFAQRLHDIHCLVLKAELSYHLNEEHIEDVFRILRANNPTVEFHLMKGEKHHVHLSSPEKVAAYVVPFISKHSDERLKTEKAKL
ncbi:probable serine hydrolase [Ceratitis capitata]|uniref:(Mediterranean fruit fly) hypothetical protein n=1 Tax=Ceratitis capitata TaxID=7213 RepID=A0A811V0K0_CERCA|nr:probable serine hydrolase [Ceratitis capitata]CAD7002923.1 unnamed protein product [Ceratitis capitata]